MHISFETICNVPITEASLCLLLTFLHDQLEQRREKYRLLSDAGGHVTAAIFSTAPAPRAAVANRNMLSGANCSMDLFSSELLTVTELCIGFRLTSQTFCTYSSPMSFAQFACQTLPDPRESVRPCSWQNVVGQGTVFESQELVGNSDIR